MTAVWAHRGAAGADPENSLGAFAAARRLGADGVELDVRRCGDGTLVVHHDAAVGGLGPLDRLLPDQLPPHVPTLDAALGACRGLLVNVEIKNTPGDPGYEPDQRIAADTAVAVEEAGMTGDVVVSCFETPTLDAVRRADPRLRLGWLLPFTAEAPRAVARAAEAGYEALHPFVAGVDEALVAAARGVGLDLHVWTVNAEGDLERMGALGVAAVITDRVAIAREVLGA